jgi:hypothetical protein
MTPSLQLPTTVAGLQVGPQLARYWQHRGEDVLRRERQEAEDRIKKGVN